MGKLRDVEKVARYAAHEDAGAVLVIIAAREVLHMGEHVAAHVGLDQHAHLVSEDGDYVVEERLYDIGERERGHHGKNAA